MEQNPLTFALFREKLLCDYRTPLEILAHLSLEFAVSPLVVRLAGIEFGEQALYAIHSVCQKFPI